MFTTDKRLVLVAFLFVFVSFLGMGAFMETSVEVSKYGSESKFESALPVEYRALGEESSSGKLKAMIKGSIYETGSNMTVFGACFDGDGYLLPGATASFTAWYPDGLIVTGPNASMFIVSDYNNNVSVPTGRWGIHVTMGSTIGTYLTEIRCDYDGQWATAYGEWQNPEWVKRIGDTQQSVNDTYNLLSNVSTRLGSFQSQVQNNFSQTFSLIAGISTGNATVNVDLSGVNNQLHDLSMGQRAIDLNIWTLDPTNPFYVLSSGTHMFSAVDMLSPNLVSAVSEDGYYVYWNNQSWSEVNTSDEWRGISLAPANMVYAYLVGTDGSNNPVLSINGASALTPLLPAGSPTAFNDVKAFLPPNNPAGAYYLYLLGDDGSVYLSNDSAYTWAYRGAVGANETGRISQVVVNYVNSQPQGFLAMIGQGGTVAVDNGNSFTTYSVSGVVKDVSLLRDDLGYVVVKGASAAYVYKYNGTGFTLDYTINDPLIMPTGVAAVAGDDVWVTTTDPSVFYHFDGYAWKTSTVGFSDYLSIVISFGNVSNVGLRDISMYDAKNGYAVGADGMILIFQKHYDAKIDQAKAAVLGAISNVQSTLNTMNLTMNYKLDAILNNVTYTQLYLETTLYPLANATYQNTLAILAALGIIDSKLNTTIELQNQTLNLTQNIDTNVQTLLNKSNRIRAWVTQ